MSQKSEPVEVGQESDSEEKSLNHLSVAEELLPRRSQRARTLTEKGKEMQDERLRSLQQRFNYIYSKWKSHVRFSKKSLSQSAVSPSEELLNYIIGDVTSLSADIQLVYEELRKISVPDQDTRRRVDQCVEVSTFVVKRASSQLEGHVPAEEKQEWPEAGSLFESSASRSGSILSLLKGASYVSKDSSCKQQEVAAEVAANQAVLKVLKEQEREQSEIQHLEAVVKRKIADHEAAVARRRLEQEAEQVRQRIQREEEEIKIKAQLEEEHTFLQKTLEEKRRRIKHLEAVKGLSAAKAKLQVYQGQVLEEDRSEDRSEVLDKVELKDAKEEEPPPPSFMQTATQQSSITSANEGTAELVKMLASALSANRIPVPEPSMFTGDPLKYNDWKLSFQTIIDQKSIQDKEKLYYLRRYVGGQVRQALDGYFLLGTESAYVAAWEILEERYGNPFVIAKAYRDKLQAWPKIGSKDSFELREFVDFLHSCETAMAYIKTLEILNDCNENRKILSKLPDWLTARWNRKVIEIEEESNRFPSFSEFVKFLAREAKIACNPITSLHSMKQGEVEKQKTQRPPSFAAKSLNTQSTERPVVKCVFCKRTGHTLHKCRNFMEKDLKERIKYVQSERLCFGCLQFGHHSKGCSNRSTCDRCKGRHPTCLHEERDKEEQRSLQSNQHSSTANSCTMQVNNQEYSPNPHTEVISDAISNRVVHDGDTTQTAAVVPVWLSSTTHPAQEVLVYALLDSQSDTTFVLEEVVDTLDISKEPVKLKLSTMASKDTVINCQRVKNLQCRGFSSIKKVSLPPAFTREFIPANRTHIPTNETAKVWSHLEHLQEEIPALQNCKVGLLIGYNCSQALLPREVVSGNEHEPFAQRTDLGWSIVGHGNTHIDFSDATGISHHVIVQQVTPMVKPHVNLKTKVNLVDRTKMKEITRSDLIRALELDFQEKSEKENFVSQEDHLHALERGIRKEKRHEDHGNFMTDTSSLAEAERFSEEERENSQDNVFQGLRAEQLKNSDWFTSPTFLQCKTFPVKEYMVGEMKKKDAKLQRSVHNNMAQKRPSLMDCLDKCFNWTRPVKAIARLKRFVKENKAKNQRTTTSTGLEERERAEETIKRQVQREAFFNEIKILKSKETITKAKHSKLWKLIQHHTTNRD